MINLSPEYRLRTNLIFIVIIAVHILLIKNYPISVEFAFINFAKYFENYAFSLTL